MMEVFHSTKEVALLLDIKPDTLNKAIWQGRVKPPRKGPSGAYLWTISDIRRVSWVLLHRDYQPESGGDNDE